MPVPPEAVGEKPQQKLLACLEVQDAAGARKGSRGAYFDGAVRDVDVYDALALRAGARIDGPAILKQPTTTIVVPPDYALEVARTGAFLVHPADRDLDDTLKELAS